MKYLSYHIFFLACTALLIAVPLLASAQDGLVPSCEGNECGFEELLLLIDNIINWLLIISSSVAALLFAWAGWLYISARGDPGQMKKANSIFWKVIVGLVIILSAWLIVDLIADTLLEQDVRRDLPFFGN